MDYGDSGSTAAEAAKIAENAEVRKTYTISADRSSCPIRSLILGFSIDKRRNVGQVWPDVGEFAVELRLSRIPRIIRTT